MKDYKYDIAISLCKDDVAFAREFVKALNPKLNVFFYEDRQEDLIAKNGAETFAKVFKEEARVVVILSRKEWSESFYTELERNAIIDRIKDGYGFLYVVPVVDDQVPPWYPYTQIYASPKRFSIVQLAQFCEFKVTELGGEVTPLTFEEKIDHFRDKYQNQINKINYLRSPESLELSRLACEDFTNIFNDKQDYWMKFDNAEIRIDGRPIRIERLGINGVSAGEIVIDDYLFRAEFRNENVGNRSDFRAGSQRTDLNLEIFKMNVNISGADKKSLKRALFRFNKDSEELIGWSEVKYIEHRLLGSHRKLYFVESVEKSYALNGIYSGADLIGQWLTEIIERIETELFYEPVKAKGGQLS